MKASFVHSKASFVLVMAFLVQHIHEGLLWTFVLAKLFEQFDKNPQHLGTGWR